LLLKNENIGVHTQTQEYIYVGMASIAYFSTIGSCGAAYSSLGDNLILRLDVPWKKSYK